MFICLIDRQRPNFRFEPLEPRRFLDGVVEVSGDEFQPVEAIVELWKQRSISLVRNEAIAASFDGVYRDDLGRFEATLAPGEYAVSIDWGDGTTSAGWIETYGAQEGRPYQAHVRGAHEYSEPGMYSIVATVTASDGETTTFSQDMIPFASPIQLYRQHAYGDATPDRVWANYNVLIFPMGVNPDDLTGTIDWGDGTTTQFSGSIGIWSGASSMGGSHEYESVGTYTITFTVTAPGSTPGAMETLTLSKELTIAPWRPPSQEVLPEIYRIQWDREIIFPADYPDTGTIDPQNSLHSPIPMGEQSEQAPDEVRKKVSRTSAAELLGMIDSPP